MVLPDKRVIACNVMEATAEAARGAAAYVRWTNGGHGNDRLALLIRSRGGRWIEKWEAISRLGNFRLKTVPPEHPLYDRLGEHSDETLAWVRDCGEYLARARAGPDEPRPATNPNPDTPVDGSRGDPGPAAAGPHPSP